jgi:hypothetical protein
MKSKLHIIGLISLSLLIFSCSNDEYEDTAVENNNLKLVRKAEIKDNLNAKITDSTSVINNEQPGSTQGEPSNPKPPRITED